MNERQRLLALLEIYDDAIEQLYVLGDPMFVDLILRLERRLRVADARLAEIESSAAVTRERFEGGGVRRHEVNSPARF